MISPVIIICTHGLERVKITTKNIRTLYPYPVILVLSEPAEIPYYETLENVTIIIAPNEPLGSKWQSGVNAARQLPHTHLIMLGSDDILAKGFIEQACSLNLDFVGLRAWYILHKGKLYQLEYKAIDNLPLGGGRVYSKQILEKIDYSIFDSSIDNLLDDQGWERVKQSNHKLIYEPELLAVKGDWRVMNKLDLKHKNVKHLKTYTGRRMSEILKNKFGYE